MSEKIQDTDVHWKKGLIAALESFGHDFKASVVAAELTDNGISPETFFFKNRSTFKRPVSRDIEGISWHDMDDSQAHLVFELNREGIYDMLPEALIHGQSRKKELMRTRSPVVNYASRKGTPAGFLVRWKMSFTTGA